MNKTDLALNIIRPAALGLGIFAASSAIGMSQTTTNPCAPAPAAADMPASTGFDSSYNDIQTWQPGWDAGTYDRNHVVIGTVDDFSPNRLTVSDPDKGALTIDLKEGTVIRPTGSTPSSGQHVAVFGYWSKGTFIANRIVLRG